jgi:hypothetical protein
VISLIFGRKTKGDKKMVENTERDEQELDNCIELAKKGRKIAILCSEEKLDELEEYILDGSKLILFKRNGYFGLPGCIGFIQLISTFNFNEAVGEEIYNQIWLHSASSFTKDQIAKVHGFTKKIDENTDSENEVAQPRDFLVFTICIGYSSVPGSIRDACILKGITEKEAAEKMGNNLLRRSNLNEPVHICVVDGSIPIKMEDIAMLRTLSRMLKGKMKFFTIKPVKSFEIEEGSAHSF